MSESGNPPRRLTRYKNRPSRAVIFDLSESHARQNRSDSIAYRLSPYCLFAYLPIAYLPIAYFLLPTCRLAYCLREAL